MGGHHSSLLLHQQSVLPSANPASSPPPQAPTFPSWLPSPKPPGC